jgi:hypothetical protein
MLVYIFINIEICWIDHGEMKKFYFESMSREISYMKYENGKLTGLITSYAETAF